MFKFNVSAGLIRHTLNDLPLHVWTINIPYVAGFIVRFYIWRLGGTPDALEWGMRVVSAIGTLAHRVRHGIHEPRADGMASDQFAIIKDGNFVPEMARLVEEYTYYIGAGRPVMRECAQELLAHLRTHGLPQLHPGAPVTHFELAGDTLIAHVRPYVLEPRDPNWIKSFRVE